MKVNKIDKILLENGAYIEVENSDDSTQQRFFIKFRLLWVGIFPEENITEYTDTFYDTEDYVNGKNGIYYRIREVGNQRTLVKQSYSTDITKSFHCYKEEKCEEKHFEGLKTLISFNFKRCNSPSNYYIDKLTDKGMEHYMLLTYKWHNPIESFDEKTLLESINQAKQDFSHRFSPNNILPTYTKFMYVMQCNRSTYLIYRNVFAQSDPAADIVKKTIEEFEEELSTVKQQYACYAEDVITRYYHYFNKGLSQEESNNLISSIITDVINGRITYGLDNSMEPIW